MLVMLLLADSKPLHASRIERRTLVSLTLRPRAYGASTGTITVLATELMGRATIWLALDPHRQADLQVGGG